MAGMESQITIDAHLNKSEESQTKNANNIQKFVKFGISYAFMQTGARITSRSCSDKIQLSPETPISV